MARAGEASGGGPRGAFWSDVEGAGRGRGARGGGALFSLIALLVVLFALGALAWMLLLPSLVLTRITERTGFAASVVQLTANPFTGRVEVKGLVLQNPPGYPAREFLTLKEFRADLRLRSLLSDRWVFETMTVQVGGLTVVRDAAGGTNADVFQKGRRSGASPAPLATTTKRAFVIRELRLKVDRLAEVEMSAAGPVRQEKQMNFDRTFAEVTDLGRLCESEGLQPLTPVVLALTALVPGDLGRDMNAAAKAAAEAAVAAGRRTGDAVKGLFEALEESRKP